MRGRKVKKTKLEYEITDEEYKEMMCKSSPCKTYKNLRRLTEEEYRNLPYGNKRFYAQFEKGDKKNNE